MDKQYNQNIALIDMDGTLANYESAMRAKLTEIFGDEVENKWFFGEHKPAIEMIKTIPGFWRNLPKIELGFKIVELLKAGGFDLHILTRGPHNAINGWSEKVEWAREHLPNTPITITEDKGLVFGRILVDDWGPYCESWLKFRPRGLVIMPAYYHNEGYDRINPGRVIRATGDNWDELKKAIENVARRLPGEATQMV